MAQYSNVIQVLYGPAIFVVKLSLLLQYLRIFVPNRKSNMAMFIAIHAVLWIDVTFYVVDTGLEIFSCTPRELIWNKLPPLHGTCIDVMKIMISTGYINVASDFAILLLPIVSTMRLQMPMRRKVGVCAVFAAGLL